MTDDTFPPNPSHGQRSTDLFPGQVLGRWAVVRALGRGGMATVWEVQGVHDGVSRALKIMNVGLASEDAARRFAREFRTLGRMEHPNIVRVMDEGVWEGRPWFVMDLVAGDDVRALVEQWATHPPQDRWSLARSIVVQVARALAYVHALGIVHRDVTPGNLRVLPDGTVRLMDFGVVKETGSTELTAHGELLGTVAYVAPEQIAGDAVDARADLYSLGAVLYLLLTGKRPFQARTLAGYLGKHLHNPPRPPSELVPGVPADLEALCLRLLEKDPAARPASATHLLRILLGPEGGPLRVDGDWPRELAGRGGEVATLGVALAACREGHGGVIVVEGGAGSGKSRLSRAVRDQGRRLDLPVMAVRARDTGNPLDVYARVYAGLRHEGLHSPVLDHLFGGHAADDARIARYTLFTAFRDMLVGTRPRVVCIDDLHWADEGSLQLLEYLVRNTRALANLPLLWVFTRDPGVNEERLYPLVSGDSTEVPAQRIRLRPLHIQAVEELVVSLVPDGPAARALAQRLHVEGEGNPAYTVEMLRGLVDEGSIREAGGVRTLARSVEEITRGPLPIPRSLRAHLAGLLDSLDPASRQVADALAVALAAGAPGGEIPVGLLAESVGIAQDLAEEAVETLVDAGLVRTRAGGPTQDDTSTLEFTQPRTRDLLYAALAPTARARLHRRIGETLERTYRRRMHLVVDALAEHFERAGIAGKAYAYLVRAGQRMLDRSFAAEAERYLQRALALEPDAREMLTLEEADRLRCETLLRRAEALDHLGRSHGNDDLADAIALATELGDDRMLSRAFTSRGQQARQLHDLALAESSFSEALVLADRLGESALRVKPLNGLAGTLWSRGDLEGARQWWAEALKVGEQTMDQRGLGFGTNGLGLVALCKGQAAEARKYFEQSADIFEKLGLLAPLATARVNLVEIHHFTGNLRRGLELAERTLAQARETGHQLGIARGRHHRAMLLVDLGRFAEGRDEAREALAVVRRLDHKEDELATLVGRLRADWALGDLASVRQGLAEAAGLVDRFDPEGFGPIVHAWQARMAAASGDLAAAQAHLARALAWEGMKWPYQECRFDLVLGRVYAAMGNRAESTRRAEAAIRRADACGFRLYALKGHQVAGACSPDEAAQARHRRVAEALARSLAANLSREDAERFLELDFVSDHFR